MKKLCISVVVSCACMFGFAQTETPTLKYSVVTNDFWSNWFVTAGIDGSSFYGDQERWQGFSQNPFRSFRTTLGFGVGIGKWFTPGIGTRIKFQGINGKSVVSENSSLNKQDLKHYWVANGQVLFNMSNLLCGYNENRFWNVIAYPGVGVYHNATKTDGHSSIYAMDVQFGIMNTFRICKELDAFIDINAIFVEPKSDGAEGGDSKQNFFQNYDKVFSAEVGLKYNFGKTTTWKKVPDVDAINALHKEQTDALNASLKSAQEENDRLKLALSKQNSEVQKLQNELNASRNKGVAPETAPAKTEKETCVFFACGKSIISNAQKANVERVANYLKANPDATVMIKGYASSEGPAGLNQKLSVARANAVKNMLVKKYGISESRITAQGCGVGNVFSKRSWNRVAISTAK